MRSDDVNPLVNRINDGEVDIERLAYALENLAKTYKEGDGYRARKARTS